MKQYEIDYNGSKTTIEIENHLKAGVVNRILKSCMKSRPGTPLPDIDYEEFMVGLAVNTVTKAPWTLKNPDAIRDLDYMTTYSQLAEILGDEFPLENFLYPIGKLMLGKKLNRQDFQLQTESTTNSQEPSAGLPNK